MGSLSEIITKSGTWSFDGGALRIVPGHGRGVHPVRAALGELTVPLEALAGVSYETGRKGGRLRLRLRDGADPLTQAAAGRLPDAADPYRLEVEKDRTGVAEYLADEVRNALLLDQVPETPATRYLMPGPPVPLTLHGSDGTVGFDGERIKIDWAWTAEESKKATGTRTLGLGDVEAVEWSPPGWESGAVRFVPRGVHVQVKNSLDPYVVVLWGLRQARETAESLLLAAAVTARLPHPAVPRASLDKPSREAADAPGAKPPPGADHDALLRRLRELGELRDAGILTEDEFGAAKKAVLDRF